MDYKSYLILGGARSGKTKYALSLAEGLQRPHSEKVYIATAEALDMEMAERIAHHRAERDGTGWLTHEEPIHIANIINNSCEHSILLIDCLTLWLSNLMHQKLSIRKQTDILLAAICTCPAKLIFVSNDVGLGIVPSTELGRTFRDEQGRLNQCLAAQVDQVEFMLAGLPMRLKG